MVLKSSINYRRMTHIHIYIYMKFTHTPLPTYLLITTLTSNSFVYITFKKIVPINSIESPIEY
jgi:hypothetical protein